MSFRAPETLWVCRQKEEEEESTFFALTQLAEKKKVDILVLGNYNSQYHSKQSQRGSNANAKVGKALANDAIIRECHTSICVVRASSSPAQPTCTMADGH